MRDVKIGEM